MLFVPFRGPQWELLRHLLGHLTRRLWCFWISTPTKQDLGKSFSYSSTSAGHTDVEDRWRYLDIGSWYLSGIFLKIWTSQHRRTPDFWLHRVVRRCGIAFKVAQYLESASFVETKQKSRYKIEHSQKNRSKVLCRKKGFAIKVGKTVRGHNPQNAWTLCMKRRPPVALLAFDTWLIW